ncbi:hypothetical protein BB934_32760 (plasmid) [Microvirga ossetica]|uniref:Uncharacterized protein n=1 Tax=Microvirga ossetica TaxID=1882682 RepID=A0A1B2ESQ4_9HYPH|nr:hypothetical protein BB934_32760 [Microvirga ossetica]
MARLSPCLSPYAVVLPALLTSAPAIQRIVVNQTLTPPGCSHLIPSLRLLLFGGRCLPATTIPKLWFLRHGLHGLVSIRDVKAAVEIRGYQKLEEARSRYG